MDEDQPPPIRTVTCRTEGCPNADIPITMPCLEYAICVPCNQVITDIITL